MQLCFPELGNEEISSLAATHWRLLGRSLVERSIIWCGSAAQLNQMIEVRTAVDLTDRKPRILVNPTLLVLKAALLLAH